MNVLKTITKLSDKLVKLQDTENFNQFEGVVKETDCWMPQNDEFCQKTVNTMICYGSLFLVEGCFNYQKGQIVYGKFEISEYLSIRQGGTSFDRKIKILNIELRETVFLFSKKGITSKRFFCGNLSEADENDFLLYCGEKTTFKHLEKEGICMKFNSRQEAENFKKMQEVLEY